MSAAGNDGKEILGSEQSDREAESYDQDPGGVHEERTRQRSIGQTAVFEIPQPGEDVEQWSPEKMHANGSQSGAPESKHFSARTAQ